LNKNEFLDQLRPIEMLFWAKHYVTIFLTVAHRMA